MFIKGACIEFSSLVFFRIVRDNRLTTARPRQASQEGLGYCSSNKCYTPTEFALFGVSYILSRASTAD